MIEINVKNVIETPQFEPAYDGVVIVGYNDGDKENGEAIFDGYMFGDCEFLAKALQTLLLRHPNLRAKVKSYIWSKV